MTDVEEVLEVVRETLKAGTEAELEKITLTWQQKSYNTIVLSHALTATYKKVLDNQ